MSFCIIIYNFNIFFLNIYKIILKIFDLLKYFLRNDYIYEKKWIYIFFFIDINKYEIFFLILICINIYLYIYKFLNKYKFI